MSGAHDDYAVEPIRGLPEKPPADEKILWQGAPSWWEIAKLVFHIRAAALYFLLLMVWRVATHFRDGDTGGGIIAASALLPIALVGLGLLALLAWLCARTSVYTITSKRVVLRIGMALPMAINIPFKAIGAAGLRASRNGSGDIFLLPSGADRMGYATLWPHVRPWHLRNPEPTLRGVPKVRQVAELLAGALADALPQAQVTLPPADRRNVRLRTQGPSPETVSPGLSVAGRNAA